MNYVSKIGIRELVEFVYRSGDLDLRFQGRSKANDGIKIHQKIQKSQGEDYMPEVQVSKVLELIEGDLKIDLLLSGRVDGILRTDNGYLIDEIKGTSVFLDRIEMDTYPVHWAQAKIYGAIYSEQNNLDAIAIQLTYASFEDDSIKRLKKTFQKVELLAFLEETVDRYKKWVVFKVKRKQRRNASMSDMNFPYPVYRDGQRKLAVQVYNAIKEEKASFIQAPTGIGKTLSTLFPAMKAFEQEWVDKIFYLSAKAVTKGVAEEAFLKIRNSNPDVSFVNLTITAKDKICVNDVVSCYPEKCEFAKGHFDRTTEALWDIMTHENSITKDVLQGYALKHTICPYEFSLDIALMADCIVCDYNYAFDPRVYLRRFFEYPSEAYVFLVDEAHNLVPRARDMYSATLDRSALTQLKKKLAPKDKMLKTSLEAVDKVMLKERKVCDENGVWVGKESVEALMSAIKKRQPKFEKWLLENMKADFYEEALDLYFQWISYIRIGEIYNDGFLTYIKNGHDTDTQFKQFCIHPAASLKRFIENAVSVVFFSATLSPMGYYSNLLLGSTPVKQLTLPSPFDAENRLLVFATDVSVKYKDRKRSLSKVCSYIAQMAAAKVGNYMAFFPSFQYMDDAYNQFLTEYGDGFDLTRQERMFSDSDKDIFLEHFSNMTRHRSMVSFVVMGSHFSEGIDLMGDKLIGTAVVGVGLPMIEFENGLISDYFDYHGGGGFEFAYQCPGVNKVMQSAGRVIRSDDDRGVILLIDERYNTSHYRRYFPEDWGHHNVTLECFETTLSRFWNEEENT